MLADHGSGMPERNIMHSGGGNDPVPLQTGVERFLRRLVLQVGIALGKTVDLQHDRLAVAQAHTAQLQHLCILGQVEQLGILLADGHQLGADEPCIGPVPPLGAGIGKAAYYAEITVNGGKVTAQSGNNGENVAIGGARSEEQGANTTITINGGEVDAMGIIGAENKAATVIITGGRVSATAENTTAVIGSYADTEVEDRSVSVTISGGTVIAVNTGTGPAIGGRGISEIYKVATNKTAGSVTITGGTVTATNNSENAATIGADNGSYYNRTNVIISGGRVNATNNMAGGVAIGGGKYDSEKYAYTDVTINGGTISNVYLEYDKDNGATVTYNDGTISNILKATESNGVYTPITNPEKGTYTSVK